MKKKTLQKCPRCGSTRFTYSKTEPEKTCKKCGLVLEENIIDAERTCIE